jgi:hypothetical protein
MQDDQISQSFQELILGLLNLLLQRQHCVFTNVEESIFAFKMLLATRSVVKFYSAGVVTHDRRIGSWC